MDFILDICRGKTRKQLCDDYRRCSRAAFRWQNIAMRLVGANPEILETMAEPDKSEMLRIIEAYKD